MKYFFIIRLIYEQFLIKFVTLYTYFSIVVKIKIKIEKKSVVYKDSKNDKNFYSNLRY